MFRIRLRYPLCALIVALVYSFMPHQLLPQHDTAHVHPVQQLDPGYYLVLNTHAKLPQDIPTHHRQNRTYIGPLPTVKSLHQYRVKIKPLYPGVATELLKVNTIPHEV